MAKEKAVETKPTETKDVGAEVVKDTKATKAKTYVVLSPFSDKDNADVTYHAGTKIEEGDKFNTDRIKDLVSRNLIELSK